MARDLSTESLLTKYTLRGVLRDPGTMMGVSMAMTAAGGGVSAMGTLAGGSYAKQAGQMQKAADDYQAGQLEEDSGTAIGTAQARMLDRQFNTKMILSTLRARASGGGISLASPTVSEGAGSIAQRGRFQSMMDLWQGENTATGMLNQAEGLRYSGDAAEIAGEEQQEASKYAAVATIMNSGASMAKTYGAFNYPTSSGQARVGASYG